LTPRYLAAPLQSLPPILHNKSQKPTSGYSKGARGLSVLLQLTSIFTRTSISLGRWLRQLGSRYAIRAGRNLPDKEFRYLRHSCYYRMSLRRLSHFCSTPYVATGIGLDHHITKDVLGVQSLRILQSHLGDFSLVAFLGHSWRMPIEQFVRTLPA